MENKNGFAVMMIIGAMYDRHSSKKSVILWCFSKPSSDSSVSRKRARSSSSEASNAQKRSLSRYDAHQSDKVAKTNEILSKLEEKHESKFFSEQLRTWANLIQLKKQFS